MKKTYNIEDFGIENNEDSDDEKTKQGQFFESPDIFI